jgi:hypothetical protein
LNFGKDKPVLPALNTPCNDCFDSSSKTVAKTAAKQ